MRGVKIKESILVPDFKFNLFSKSVKNLLSKDECAFCRFLSAESLSEWGRVCGVGVADRAPACHMPMSTRGTTEIDASIPHWRCAVCHRSRVNITVICGQYGQQNPNSSPADVHQGTTGTDVGIPC